jgi:hypothetical protein
MSKSATQATKDINELIKTAKNNKIVEVENIQDLEIDTEMDTGA